MQYYHNNKKIWTFEVHINMSSYPAFTPLTDSQTQFYINNPAATLQEVLNCALFTPSPAALSDYKEWKTAEMSDLSLHTALQKYPQYVRDNILLSVYEESEERKAVMREYFIAMRNEFYRLKALIESAGSNEEVDEICNGQNFNRL